MPGARYKKLKCPLINKKHCVCGGFIGDIEANVAVKFRGLCRNHRPSRMIEFRQTEQGVIFYREVGQNEYVKYDDDNVRLADG
jgi:hypothetical protein